MRRDTRRLRLLLVLLTLTSLTLVTLDVRSGGSGGIGSIRSAFRDVVGPIESALSAVWRPIKGAGSAVTHLGRDRATAKRLAQENAELRARLDALGSDAAVKVELDKLLGLSARGQYRIVPARVIALGDVTGYEWTAVIDAGANDHLRKNMTVTTGDGLVGRVLSVSRYTSVVLMIIDHQSTVGARLEKSDELGKIDGDGTNPLRFTLFGTATTIKVGQRIVSFGSSGDGPYVAGVPIGEVTSIVSAPGGLTREALVKPYVSMTSLDVVGVVIAPPRTDPRDSVLPPKPTPTPSVQPSPSSPASPNPSGSPGTVTTTPPSPGSSSPSPSPSPSGR